MSSFFPICSETYKAIDEWLDIIDQYDDEYIKDGIIAYKTRRIQANAVNKNKDFSNLTSSVFKLDDSITQKRFSGDLVEMHSIELVSKNYNTTKLSLSDSLEVLSENIDDIYDDEDDGIFDVFI